MSKNRKRFPHTRKNKTILDDDSLIFASLDFLDVSANKSQLSLSEMEINEDNLTLNKKDFNYLLKLLKNNRKNLSSQEKNCIFKYYWQQKTQQQIANSLKISRVVVGIYIKRARQKIASVLIK